MLRQLPLAILLIALPLRGERVRVVVNLEPHPGPVAADTATGDLAASLPVESRLEAWDRSGRTFSAEIDGRELLRLQRDPRVRAISIDRGGQGALNESLPLVGIEPARVLGLDGSGIVVAVLDTGIDAGNPDFSGRVFAEQCFCDNLDGTGCCPDGSTEQSGSGAAADDHGHGTHVAGILAGGGSSAPAGVAPRAGIVAVKVMDKTNSFRSFTQIYRALEWIAAERPDVRVINMSLGSFALYAPAHCDTSAIALGLEDVVMALRQRGVLITASSGNQGSLEGTTLPACMSKVIGVGATYDSAGDQNAFCAAPGAVADQVTCFTNSTASVDLVAPGALILASRRGGGTAIYAGTSMAAPHVAGALALMQQVSAGDISADLAEQIVTTTGTSVLDSRNGLLFRRLDIASAVAATPHASDIPRRRAARH